MRASATGFFAFTFLSFLYLFFPSSFSFNFVLLRFHFSPFICRWWCHNFEWGCHTPQSLQRCPFLSICIREWGWGDQCRISFTRHLSDRAENGCGVQNCQIYQTKEHRVQASLGQLNLTLSSLQYDPSLSCPLLAEFLLLSKISCIFIIIIIMSECSKRENISTRFVLELLYHYHYQDPKIIFLITYICRT